MKCFRNYFEPCFFFFLALGLSVSEAKNEAFLIPQERVPEAQMFLKALASQDSKGDLSSTLKTLHSQSGNLFPVYEDDTRRLALWVLPDSKWILGWDTQDPETFSSKNGDSLFPKHTGVFSPPDFDAWLLTQPSVLESVIQNGEFLPRWIEWDEPRPTQNEALSRMHSYVFRVKPPRTHYNLAAVIGEDRFFPDITENDHELSFLHCPLIHYTLGDDRTFYFCKLASEDSLKLLPPLLDRFLAEEKERTLFKACLQTTLTSRRRSTFPSDDRRFISAFEGVLDTAGHQYDFSNIPSENLPKLLEHIRIFLHSNGVASMAEFSKADRELKGAVSIRFLTAKTTSFFRDWREMKYLKTWLSKRDEHCRKEKRPLKILVFGASTGQEPLSYAFDFLDLGIDHFRILATDIDPAVIQQAKDMRYEEDKFAALPSEKRGWLLDTYFESDEEGGYRLRFPAFMRERLEYRVQDITETLHAGDNPDFQPPYDLVSVKNVLLYLDPKTIESTVKKLSQILAPGGILILRDKKYRASQFLSTELKDCVGLTDYFALKVPDPKTLPTLKALFEDFSNPLAPALTRYFYEYAMKKKFYSWAPELVAFCAQSSPLNLNVQRVLFNDALDHEKLPKAYEILKHIGLQQPAYFMALFPEWESKSSAQDVRSASNAQKLTSLYGTLTRQGAKNMRDDDVEKEFDALSQDEGFPAEMALALVQALLYRDAGQFPESPASKDGKWIRLGLRFLDQLGKIQKKNIPVFLDYQAQLLENKILLFEKDQISTASRSQIQALLAQPTVPATPYGRVSWCRLAVLFCQNDALSLSEKKALLTQVLSSCVFSETELDLFSDKKYADCFGIVGQAHLQLEGTGNLSRENRMKHLQSACRAFDEALTVESVYGNYPVYRDLAEKKLAKLKEQNG